MDLLNRVCRSFLDKIFKMFIDHILIYSTSWEEHKIHLQKILEHLRKEKFYAKYSECEFRLNKVEVLSHDVSEAGVKVDPIKIKTIMEWESPKNTTEIHSFLGLVGYYRRFIEGFLTTEISLKF